MPSAEIITIGTELLLGEIVDTNARFIARKLRDEGIDLYRKTTVGDNTHRIADAIQQAMERCDIVITTGGLGPTIDDPTRDAVASAVNTKTEFRQELWEQIQARFRRFGRPPTDNNKRQAYVPVGSLAVENPVGTAPAFIVEQDNHAIIALPGVPREMQYLLKNAIFPYLHKRYELAGIIKSRIIHTAGAGESQIDDLIGDLEVLSNPTVGLAAHSGQVDVRITAKAETESEADELIADIEFEVRKRLGVWVYGADNETLEEVALRKLSSVGWSLAVIEAGLGGNLIQKLTTYSDAQSSEFINTFQGGEVLAELPDSKELAGIVSAYREKHQVDVGFGVVIHPGPKKQEVHMVMISPDGQEQFSRPFGGPPEYASRWALHHSLNLIRKI